MDADGNIIVVGHDGSATRAKLEQVGGTSFWHDATADVFVRKLNRGGEPLWSRRFGGDGFDYARGAAIGRNGTIFVVGVTGSSSLRGLKVARQDGFLTAYSKDGQRLWTRLLGGPLDDAATNVVVTPTGDVVVSGYATGATSDWPPEHVTFLGTEVPGKRDIFVAKFSAGGARLWTSFLGNQRSALQTPGGLAVGQAGEIVVGGQTVFGLRAPSNGAAAFLIGVSTQGQVGTPVVFRGDGEGFTNVRSIAIKFGLQKAALVIYLLNPILDMKA